MIISTFGGNNVPVKKLFFIIKTAGSNPATSTNHRMI